jgi:transposase
MSIVADTFTYVVGVDTHAATHQYAVVLAATGGVVDQAEFPTSRAGLARAVAWIGRRTGGQLDATLVSAEGTGSYGAPLAALLTQTGYRVVDAPSPKRDRGSGKNDQIDAVLAARGALHKRVERLADARAGELQATLQTLLTARESMCGERTRAINALNALLRVHDLGVDARRKVSRPTIRTIAAWRTRQEPLSLLTARAEGIRLARRVPDLDIEVKQNTASLRAAITKANQAVLLDQHGVGPVNAGIVLAAWSHPGRVRNEAAFAKLGGVCPLEVSSGQHHEHRLNRTGDRQLNRALHSIAKTRMQHDPRTRAYLERRTTEGLTKPGSDAASSATSPASSTGCRSSTTRLDKL